MNILLLLSAGAAAGITGGLLGIGGGIILMPVLRFGAGFSPPEAAGTCIIAVFFITLGGSIRHYISGTLRLRPLLPAIISGAFFTALFSMLFIKAAQRPYLLDLGIASVFFLVSSRMALEGITDFAKGGNFTERGSITEGSSSCKIFIGATGGILPGLLGIGTGAVLVPAFRFMLGFPVKAAIASSLACFSINAFISSVFKILQGYSDLRTALILSAGALIGADMGARINKKSPPAVLKILFGLLFFIIALKYTGII